MLKADSHRTEIQQMASNTSSTTTQKQVERVGETAHQAIDTAADYAGRLGEKAEEWMEMKDDWVEGTRERMNMLST